MVAVMGEGTGWTRRAALGLIPALGLAGCAGRSDDAGTAPLSMWAMSWEGDYSPFLMPRFTARTGIDVDVQSLPTTASHEKLLTAFAGGAMPDVLMLFNTWVKEFATIGALAPVTAAPLVADVFPALRASTQVGAHDYAVPWSVAPQVQFYRRDILAEAGYDSPPEDWAGWRTMARAIKRRRPDDYVFLMLLNWPTALVTMLSQAGAAMLRDHDTRGDFQTPEAREAFAYYVSLYTDGYAPMVLSTEMQDPVAAFATGYCSVWPSGPPTLKDFARRADLIPADKWSTARLPGPNGYGAVSGLSASLCVSTQTKRPREAWALVNHLTSVESELDYQRLIGNLPARTDAWGAPQLALPVLQPFAEQTRALSVTPNVIEWERIQIEIQSAAERVIRGVQTLDAALAALDERVDRLLAKRRALLDRGAIT